MALKGKKTVKGVAKAIGTYVEESMRVGNVNNAHDWPFFAKIVETVDDAIITTDENFHILSWNPAAQNIYGFQEDEALGKYVGDLLQTQFPHMPYHEVVEVLNREGHWKGEIIQTKKDSSNIRLLSSVSTLHNDNGTVLRGYVIVNHDITERLEIKDALLQNEQQLGAIFENAPMGIAMINTKGQFVRLNHAFCETFGYKRDELIGAEYQLITHNRDRALEKQKMQPLLSGRGESFQLEKRGTTKGGHVLYLYTKVSVLRGVDRKVVGLVQQVIDISDRKLAEEALRHKERLLQGITTNLRDGLFRVSPDRGFLYANQYFANLFGYDSVQEVLNLPPERIDSFYPRQGDRRRFLKELKRSGFIKNEELLCVRKDGSRFWGLRNTSIAYDSEGNMYIDGAIIDITELKHYQELMEEKNKALEKTNMELDRFVYSASHDLRAPLTTIQGLLQLSKNSNLEDMSRYLSMIDKTVQKLLGVINDVVNYSRNNRSRLKTEPVDLGQIVRQSFKALSFLPDAEVIEKHIEISNAPFYSDPERINIIVSNLLNNAIRYHRHQSGDAFINVKVKVNADQASITIEDNGQGIEKEHIDKVFDMFYRANENSTGSGLGLYIVKETVYRMQGRIDLQTKLGYGSTFKITLPNFTNEEDMAEETAQGNNSDQFNS